MSSYDQIIADAANSQNVDPSALLAIAQIESADNAAATNKSGATGLFQFMPGTAAQYGLTDRTDPAASAQAAAKLMADNSAILTKALGRPPTAGELYLAHQQGAGGAVALLTHPDTPAVDVVGSAAVTQNGGTPGMTAGQFAGIWTGKADQITSQIKAANPSLSSGTPIANAIGSPDDRAPFAPPPLVPPANIPVPAVPPDQQGSPSANYYDPANTAPLQSSTDMNYPVQTLSPPAFPLGDQWMTPQSALTTQGTPPPMPSSAPSAPPPKLVRLASGKMIAPGTYGDTQVSDDGNGNAVVTVTRSPLAAGPGTIVGGVAGKMVAQGANQVGQQVQGALNTMGSGIDSLGSQAQAGLSNLGSGAMGMLSGLFGSKPPAGPASYTAPPPVSGYVPSNPNWLPPRAPTIASDQGDTPAGWSLNPQSAPALPSVTPPAPPVAPIPFPLPSFAAPVVQQPNPIQQWFNGTPLGHVVQAISGQPVTGGLLSMFNPQASPSSSGGKSSAAPTSQPQYHQGAYVDQQGYYLRSDGTMGNVNF